MTLHSPSLSTSSQFSAITNILKTDVENTQRRWEAIKRFEASNVVIFLQAERHEYQKEVSIARIPASTPMQWRFMVPMMLSGRNLFLETVLIPQRPPHQKMS